MRKQRELYSAKGKGLIYLELPGFPSKNIRMPININEEAPSR